MPRHHRLPPGFAAWLVLLLVPCSIPAAAGTLESETEGVSAGPATRLAGGERQRALESASGWRDFEARHGRWSAAWNAVTGTPHRAVGRPIALSGNPHDSLSIEQAVRAFVAAEPGVFGAGPALETAAVFQAGAD